MRWKSLLAIVVTNIFLLLFVSLFLEYNGLSARFEHLDYIISSSFESAIVASTASEELFTEKAEAARMTSYGDTNDIDKVVGNATLMISNNGECYRVNPYRLAYYYENMITGSNYIRMPHGDAINTQVVSQDFTTATAFNFMFGDVGSAYLSSEYDWGAKSRSTRYAYASSNYGEISIKPLSYGRSYGLNSIANYRTPRTDFQMFYSNIGRTITRQGPIKVADGSGWFNVNVQDYVVLDQMGLDFGLGSATHDLTAVNDNMVSSLKIGKILYNNAAGTNSGAKTFYYLTPYSLGVTYVPLKVLKPVTLATLETNIRLSLLASNSFDGTTDLSDVFQQADGCLETGIWNLNTNTPRQHTAGVGEWILNDGDIEYDLNSVQVKVDYFKVNFFGQMAGQDNAATSLVVTRVLGARPGYSDLTQTIWGYRDTSTGRKLGQDYGDRLVARCSIRMKVHVPYKNPVFQLARFSEGDTGHYDIKVWDGAAGGVSTTDDGIWYEYTTYYCIAQ